MKIRTIFAIGIASLMLMPSSVKAQDVRISEEQRQESQNFSATKINRNNAMMLLSEQEEPTVVETWDISATEEDNVIATLYNDGTLNISGTGNMKNFSTIKIDDREYSPWYDNRNNIINIQMEDDIENIGNAAFFDCRQLKNITISKKLTYIGEYAFRYCNSLEKILLPESIRYIGGSAFMDCSSLLDINIPNKVTEISGGLFYNCTSLVKINIPEGVTFIGRNAFGGCSSLTNISIPKSVTVIEEYPLNNCKKLETITVDEENNYYTSDLGVLFNKHKTYLICYPSNKKDVSKYLIPDTVESIESYSFDYCTNLKEIIIPENTKKIGGLAFNNCINLTSITIPKSVTNIENKILLYCTNLKNINVYCNSYAEEYITENYNDKLNIIHTEVIDNRIEPTCTAKGKTEGKHCSVCNKVLVAQQEIAALGHNLGEWVIDKQPTYEEEGHKYRICTNCHTEKQEEVIAKLTQEELQVTTVYPVKEKGNQKYIIITAGTQVGEALGNITSNKELEIVSKEGNVLEERNLVGTGLKVVTQNDKQEVYTIVVKGDVDGDGIIDFINDIVMINNYRLKRISLDIANILAGDVDENGVIDFINDIVKINNYRLHRINTL